MFTTNFLYDIIFFEIKCRGDKMNQILDYAPNGNPKKSSNSSDTVVRVFAVLLVIFSHGIIKMEII